jgi:protease I
MKGRFSHNRCLNLSVRSLSLVLLSLASIAAAAARQAQPQQRPTQQRPAQPEQPRRSSQAARLRTVQLPAPATSSAVSFEQAVIEQQKIQPPGDQPLDLQKISQLAWATQGVIVPAPIAGPGPAQVSGEAPIQVYFVLSDGLYAYQPASHALQPISDGDIRAPLAGAILKQAAVPAGGCQIILAASTRDFTARHGTRARTVMALLAGKVSQNIHLQAVAQGLTFLSVDSLEPSDLRRVARIPRNYEPLYVAIIGYPADQAPRPAAQPTTPQAGRRALLVVAPRGFQDEELFVTQRALEFAGVRVAVASTRAGALTGMFGGTAQANVALNQASVDDYDAVVFIGGTGALDLIGNPAAAALARQAAARQKVLAGIGTGPGILAVAGVMQGVRSTAFVSEQERLVRAGAFYTGNPAEKDGRVVTAFGPAAAPLFSQAILEALGELGR